MLRRSILIAFVLASASVHSFSQSEPVPVSKTPVTQPVAAADVPDLIEGKVTMVADGETLRVKTSADKTFTVRIHGIDAPENEQDFFASSRRLLESLVLDKEVTVMVHRLDSHGRYMGTVFHKGQDIGLRVLENGAAWHYKRVSGEQGSAIRARYAAAELKARDSRAGLWAEAMPIPPWEFREIEEGDDKTSVASAVTVPVRTDPMPPAVEKPVDESKSGAGAAKPARVYLKGPRGGCYYVNDSGSKVYVKDKSVCQNP